MPALKPPNHKRGCALIALIMKGRAGSYLELGDHSGFTRPLFNLTLSFIVFEDLVKKLVVGLLKQAN